MTRIFAALLTAGFMLGFAAAQTVHRTGFIEGTLDGQPYHAYTYATEVPANVADSATDEAQREILARVAGTTQHSATFMHMDAMVMGSIVLMPATIFVSTVTRTDHPDGWDVGTIDINFSLSPDTLELGPQQDIAVRYNEDGLSFRGFFALSNGVLELSEVTVVDSQTLRITGSITGQFSWQEGYEVVHDPATAFDADLTFTLEQVASSDLAFELVTGE